MTTPSIDAELIRRMPKVELHIHLEGCFTPARIAELAERADEPPPRPLGELWAVDNLADFLLSLDWVCSLVRDAETAETIALDFARYAHDQGIAYAEVIVNPTHWTGLSTDTLFAALASGFDRAARGGLGDFRLLPSILRQQSADDAVALVRWMGAAGIDRIVGLSIDGNEAAAGRTGTRFAGAYALARSLGLGATAHAGESSGAEGVRDAIELLGVSRIDHGIRCVEDPAVLDLVIERGITLNLCLTSNCTLVYGHLDAHPVVELARAGVSFTINTDDPETLGVTLCSELELAGAHLGWTTADLVAAQRRAVRAAFCDPTTRLKLTGALDRFAQGG